jgi:ribosomal protein S24E
MSRQSRENTVLGRAESKLACIMPNVGVSARKDVKKNPLSECTV